MKMVVLLYLTISRKRNDPRVQAMFKRSRDKNLSIFTISQDYYVLPRRTIRANENIYHIINSNNFRDVQNLYRDEASIDMRISESKYLTGTCWNKQYQPLNIDITKDQYTGRYRLGLNSISVPNTSAFSKEGKFFTFDDNLSLIN